MSHVAPLDTPYPYVDPSEAFATHFGVVPDTASHPNMVEKPVIQFSPTHIHDDPSEETLLWKGPGVTAYVSGSWKCWAPADQETEGDISLHVVVYTPMFPSINQLDYLVESLWNDVEDGRGRVVDYAWVGSAEDWSELSHIVTFEPSTAIHTLGVERPWRPRPRYNSIASYYGPRPRRSTYGY